MQRAFYCMTNKISTETGILALRDLLWSTWLCIAASGFRGLFLSCTRAETGWSLVIRPHAPHVTCLVAYRKIDVSIVRKFDYDYRAAYVSGLVSLESANLHTRKYG